MTLSGIHYAISASPCVAVILGGILGLLSPPASANVLTTRERAAQAHEEFLKDRRVSLSGRKTPIWDHASPKSSTKPLLHGRLGTTLGATRLELRSSGSGNALRPATQLPTPQVRGILTGNRTSGDTTILSSGKDFAPLVLNQSSTPFT